MSGTSHSAKRFLMAIAVAVVVGVTYVASATGSGVQAGPTARQFAALKKQVAALAKKVNTTQNDLNGLATFYAHCSLHSIVGVDQRGDTSGAGLFGYSYTAMGGGTMTTALDLAPEQTATYAFTPYNRSDAACTQLIGQALRHNAASVFAQNIAQKP